MKKIVNPQGVDITYLYRDRTHMFNTSIGTNSIKRTSVNPSETPLGQRDRNKKS